MGHVLSSGRLKSWSAGSVECDEDEGPPEESLPSTGAPIGGILGGLSCRLAIIRSLKFGFAIEKTPFRDGGNIVLGLSL